MHTPISASLALAIGFSVASCAHQGAPLSLEQQLAERGYTQGEAVRDIQNYRVDGWNYLDSQHLIINTGPSDRYLVTLRTHCHALSSTESIVFTDTAGRLTRFDSVVVEDSAGLRRDCPIEALEKLQKLD